ncbi:hypothetical protein ACHAXT_002495 [Thalassiosira profunda]
MIANRQFIRAAVDVQRHLNFRHIQRLRYPASLSLMAAAAAAAAFVSSSASDDGFDGVGSSMHRRSLCQCQGATPSPTTVEATTAPTPKPLSRTALLLNKSKLYPHSYLPVPRLLTPSDPLFSYPELKRGLARRRRDEAKVQSILTSPQLAEARRDNDQAKLQKLLQEMNTVVYGKGITPQLREDFLMQYGCTGYTEEVLAYLLEAFGRRGILEVGAGNGQWARALTDRFDASRTKQGGGDVPKSWEFVLAYDNMEQMPLSPKVYHKNTLPANQYFYDVLRSSHIDAVKSARGRALLLVYPPPGPMALETVQAYVDASPGYVGSCQNDTVVYVGEGRGGANADDAFFDYLLGKPAKEGENVAGDSQQWVLEKVLDVRPSLGGKGYEKLFVLRRICR